MTLSTIDLGPAGTTSKDIGPQTVFAAPDAAPPPSAFSQLMATAFERMAKTPGTAPGIAETGQDLATPQQTDEKAPATQVLTDSSLLPVWMQGLPANLAVQQINVGPHLQAITTRAPAPDDSSLLAFAQAQGLDAQAIAWLLNKPVAGQHPASGVGAPPLDVPAACVTPVSATAPVAALMPSAMTSAPPTAAPLSPLPATHPDNLGTTDRLAVSAAAPLTLPPTTSAAHLSTTTDRLAVSAAASPASPLSATPAHAGNADSLAAAAAWLSSAALQEDGASSTPNRHSDIPATSAETDNPLFTPGLRWVQPSATASILTAQAENARAAKQATPGAWSESELDLSELLAADKDPSISMAAADADADTSHATPADRSLDAPKEWPGLPRQGLNATVQRADSVAHTATAHKLSSDQAQQLSEQMADAIGERIIREIERGHWNLRLMLKPAHLGHIEVEMRLRGGELDASFAAPQAATRELLQDGLGRLKDSLSQMGMDVANLDVRTGQNRQNGGDPTPGQGQTAQNPGPKETSVMSAQSPTPSSRPRRADGWDVMV